MSVAPPVLADEFFTTSATGEAQGWFSIAEFFFFFLLVWETLYLSILNSSVLNILSHRVV